MGSNEFLCSEPRGILTRLGDGITFEWSIGGIRARLLLFSRGDPVGCRGRTAGGDGGRDGVGRIFVRGGCGGRGGHSRPRVGGEKTGGFDRARSGEMDLEGVGSGGVGRTGADRSGNLWPADRRRDQLGDGRTGMAGGLVFLARGDSLVPPLCIADVRRCGLGALKPAHSSFAITISLSLV